MRLLSVILSLVALSLFALSAAAGPAERPGWVVHQTKYGYNELIEHVKAATKANGMGVVTDAGPTEVAKKRGVTIPGNRVIGVFNNVYAVKMLEASLNAMIEAPVRFYITENADGTAALSYKKPTHVFEPYAGDSPAVMELAAKLDAAFATIAAAAIK